MRGKDPLLLMRVQLRRYVLSPHPGRNLKVTTDKAQWILLLFQRATALGQGQPFLGQVFNRKQGINPQGEVSAPYQVHWKSKRDSPGRSLRASELASSSFCCD